MPDPGFMIALNQRDFEFPFDGGMRDICSATNEQIYTQAPWWTCQNIQLTTAGTATPSAKVGTTYVIQVGVAGLPSQSEGDTPAAVQNVEAWVCYPNTVPGGASPTLVVPSMQNNNFASFSNTLNTAPLVFWNPNDYQDPKEGGFVWVNLSPWTPTEEDFLEQSVEGGHCCIIANAAGQSSLENVDDPNSGEPVGVVITDNSQLSAVFNICNSLYQGQRNILIVPAPLGGQISRPGLVFVSGAPEGRTPLRTTVSVAAIDQGTQVDPVILKALSSGQYASLSLKPASSPPKSLRLARHDLTPRGWLAKIIHEAEEIVEEVLGFEKHPFGGGHQLHLSLPTKGLQPLSVAVELNPNEPPGTVHAVDITQTDPNGTRGGIRVGVVVTP